MNSRVADRKVIPPFGTLEQITSKLQQSIGIANIKLQIAELRCKPAEIVSFEKADGSLTIQQMPQSNVDQPPKTAGRKVG